MIEFTNTLADTWTVENIKINQTGITTERSGNKSRR
jgi:hypothetical protein